MGRVFAIALLMCNTGCGREGSEATESFAADFDPSLPTVPVPAPSPTREDGSPWQVSAQCTPPLSLLPASVDCIHELFFGVSLNEPSVAPTCEQVRIETPAGEYLRTDSVLSCEVRTQRVGGQPTSAVEAEILAPQECQGFPVYVTSTPAGPQVESSVAYSCGTQGVSIANPWRGTHSVPGIGCAAILDEERRDLCREAAIASILASNGAYQIDRSDDPLRQLVLLSFKMRRIAERGFCCAPPATRVRR